MFCFFKCLYDYYIGCGFVVHDFYYVEICSLYIHFDESFYLEWTLNFVKYSFLHLLRCSCGFVFPFVNVMYHNDWLAYVEPSLCDTFSIKLIWWLHRMNLRVFPPLQVFGINISYLYGLIEYTSEAVSQSVMNFCLQGVFLQILFHF